jgi:DNA replication regulator SLD3
LLSRFGARAYRSNGITDSKQPHPSTVFDKPRSLRPIALLPRSELPLSCLDTRSSSSPLPDTRLFETHVKILELEERMGSTPMVLIARLDDGKTHFAVELEARGVYALCKIGSWVNLEKLCGGAVVSRYRSAARKNESGQFLALQTQTDIAQITPESSKYSKKKRLAIEAIQSMVKRPSGDLAPISQVSPILPEPTSVLESQTHAPAIIASPDKYIAHPVVTDDILDNIRSQYFEALYLSKVSTPPISVYTAAHLSRPLSHTLPKDLSLGLVQLST